MADFWSVAVDAPLHEPLTYQAPKDLADQLKRGLLVNVPLGRRNVKGLLLSQTTEIPDRQIKPIRDIDPEYQSLPEYFLKWIEWLAQYYLHPIGSVMTSAYPPLRKTEKQRKSNRPPVVPLLENVKPPVLTKE